jgi:hypothetical protein
MILEVMPQRKLNAPYAKPPAFHFFGRSRI